MMARWWLLVSVVLSVLGAGLAFGWRWAGVAALVWSVLALVPAAIAAASESSVERDR